MDRLLIISCKWESYPEAIQICQPMIFAMKIPVAAHLKKLCTLKHFGLGINSIENGLCAYCPHEAMIYFKKSYKGRFSISTDTF